MLYNGFFNDKMVYITADKEVNKSDIDLILRQLNSTYKQGKQWTFSTPDQINILRGVSDFVESETEKFSSIINYNKRSDKFDIACLIDGLAIKMIDMELQSAGCQSYVINLGYNTLYRNVLDCTAPLFESTLLKHELEVGNKSSFCVFKAQMNKQNRYLGPDMLGKNWSLAIVTDEVNDPVFYDILTTTLYTGTCMNYITNAVRDIFVFDDAGHITEGIYMPVDQHAKLTPWEKRQVRKDFPQFVYLEDYSGLSYGGINDDKSKKLLYAISQNNKPGDMKEAIQAAQDFDCTLIIYDPESHHSRIITDPRNMK